MLTFDIGFDRGYAAEVLDTLAAKGLTASFGMTGHWSETSSDLVRRIAQERHFLINHTLTHRSFTGTRVHTIWDVAEAPAERVAEVEATEAILRGIVGRGAKPWFRPP